MPSARRWLRRKGRRIAFLALRRLMRLTGFAGARRAGRLLAEFQFRAAGKLRRRCLADLAGLLGRPAGDPAVRELLRQAYRANTIALLEVLALFDRPPGDAELEARCRIDGTEQLPAALAAGRGAILLGAHMGNGALLAARLARSGLPVSIVYRQARMMSPGFFESGLSHYGIEAIQANAGLRAYAAMLQALKRGRILFVMIDQGTRLAQDGILLRFLGKDMPISAGPAQLARQSRAPVLAVAASAAEPAWQFAIEPPLADLPGPSLESDVLRLAHVTERHILRHPELWSWHQRRWRKFPLAVAPP